MKFTSSFFRTQPRVIEREQHGEPYQDVIYVDEPAHVVRSVGNCVGLPASRNTNRPNPEYARRHDRIARKNGFMNAAHRAIFNAMMTAKIEAQKGQK